MITKSHHKLKLIAREHKCDWGFIKNLEEIKNELLNIAPDYAGAKIQAEKIDLALGFNCYPIEKILLDKHQANKENQPRQFWYGLDIQSLQTPYSELVTMFQHLKPAPGEHWIDLGAGYGRMGIVLSLLAPLVHFTGHEYVAARVDEANRIYKHWKLTTAKMKQTDIASENFEIESADLYFIYDFGSREDVYKVLEKLAQISKQKSIRVIARGRGIRNWILMDFSWLSQVHSPEHFENWSLFRS